MAKRPEAAVQLIVRRGARRRFEKLKQKTAGLPVDVAWDRRRQERRTSSTGRNTDRRKADRRQSPPFTWELSDFVVVEKTRRPKQK